MCVGRTAEGLSVVSDTEVLFMFVILGNEDPTRNVAEKYKNIKTLGWGEKRKYKTK
jgi:hypothetical protein